MPTPGWPQERSPTSTLTAGLHHAAQPRRNTPRSHTSAEPTPALPAPTLGSSGSLSRAQGSEQPKGTENPAPAGASVWQGTGPPSRGASAGLASQGTLWAELGAGDLESRGLHPRDSGDPCSGLEWCPATVLRTTHCSEDRAQPPPCHSGGPQPHTEPRVPSPGPGVVPAPGRAVEMPGGARGCWRRDCASSRIRRAAEDARSSPRPRSAPGALQAREAPVLPRGKLSSARRCRGPPAPPSPPRAASRPARSQRQCPGGG